MRDGMRRLGGALAGALLLYAGSALAVPVTTAPQGDLNADGEVTSFDLQCLVLLHQTWTLQKPVVADACDTAADCGALELCRVGFGGFKMCIPDCVDPSVSLGESASIQCTDPGADTPDCKGLVQKRNADLNCDGDITNVEFQFMVQILLNVIGGADSADHDGDGLLNFCDPDSDGDDDPDVTDCGDLDNTRGAEAPELCDGIDNDCDLLIDGDDADVAIDDVQPCESQVGACSGANKPAGLCVGGSWDACGAADYLSANAQYEQTEESCDGVDNDCDGGADAADPDIVSTCCATEADCGAGETCDAGSCIPGGGDGDTCGTDADCGNGFHCDEGTGQCAADGGPGDG